MMAQYHQILVAVWWCWVPMTGICITGYAAGWVLGRFEERAYRRRQAVRKAMLDRIAARKLAVMNRTFARQREEILHG